MTKKEQKEQNNLENFEWEDSGDFFGITKEETDPVKTIKDNLKDDEDDGISPTVDLDETKKEDKKKEEKEDEKEDKKEKKKEEEKDDEEDSKKKEEDDDQKFFEKKEFAEKGDEDNDEEEKPSTLKEVVQSLNKSGFFLSVDEEKGLPEDLSDEDAEDLFEQEVNHRLVLQMEDLKEQAGSEGTELMKFLKSGGTVSQFLQLHQTHADLEDFKKEEIEESEEEAAEFLKAYYEDYEEMDKEDIEDKIDFLKERGKLNTTATKFFNKLQTLAEKNKQKALEQQTELEKKRQKSVKEYKAELKKTIEETDTVGKVKITKKEKTELYDYLTKPTVKTEKGFITGLQKDLAEIYKNKAHLIALAKVIKERFDIEDFASETKATQKIKKSFREGSRRKKPTQLADMFS